MPDTPKLQVKRNSVNISCNSSPQVHLAKENVTWQTGNVEITGLGKTRAEALSALDEAFENLKQILSESNP